MNSTEVYLKGIHAVFFSSILSSFVCEGLEVSCSLTKTNAMFVIMKAMFIPIKPARQKTRFALTKS